MKCSPRGSPFLPAPSSRNPLNSFLNDKTCIFIARVMKFGVVIQFNQLKNLIPQLHMICTILLHAARSCCIKYKICRRRHLWFLGTLQRLPIQVFMMYFCKSVSDWWHLLVPVRKFCFGTKWICCKLSKNQIWLKICRFYQNLFFALAHETKHL